MPTAKRAISSRVTIKNPRPRKYASAAERQKALRERFPTLCVRVEQEQADFMKRIADEQGRTLQDVHLAFIKYANGRGNQWLTQGLKGFAPLPRFEEPPKENPTMKRKPTPAQIAARERFAEMARSGAFKKKAAKARKKNPMIISKQADESLSRKGSRGYVRDLLDRYANEGHVVSVKKTRSGSIGIALDGGRLLTVESARKKLENFYGITERMKRRSNPRASNPIILVSDKPVASKRKANPVKRSNPMIKYALVPDDGGFTYGMDDRTPVQFVFSSRDRTRGIYRSFELPSAVTSNPEFQRFASRLPGNSIIASLADLRKMMKQYI